VNQSKAFLTSLVFAALAMLLVYFYVSEQESGLKAEFGTDVPVVVAAQDINEFEQIESGMLTTVLVPKKFAQPGSNPDPKTFEGSVASAPFRKGEQVLTTKVLLKGAETGLASQVAISYRALSIPVNDVTGVTRLLKPGDRIDIIANVPYQGTNGQETEVKTLLQNVHVLAVGELIQNNIPSVFETDPLTGNRIAKNIRGSRSYSTVTVEVTPIDAQALIYVVQSGTDMFLTLRNPVDRVVASIPTTTVDEVLGPNSKKAARAREEEMRRRALAAPPPPRVSVKPPAPSWFKGEGGGFSGAK
jgi:pilus assembly protein CpaB